MPGHQVNSLSRQHASGSEHPSGGYVTPLAALEIFVTLGFIVNTKKSVFQPSQKLEFLGFLINTRTMQISLPRQKLHSIQTLVRQIMSQRTTTTRQLARAMGMISAAHFAVLPVPLHFRALERENIRAAKMDPTYNMTIQISPPTERDLQW